MKDEKKLKGTVFLMAQVDHLSGEDIGWAMDALDMDGVYNRNIIPTLTKKGRMGYLILLEIDRDKEKQVGSFLLDTLNTHGYHKIRTTHVHCETVTKERPVVVEYGKESVQTKVRVKRKKSRLRGPYLIESDDLFVIERLISEKFGLLVPIKKLRQLIEDGIEARGRGTVRIRL